MHERPITSVLVYHKSNPEILFIAFSFNKENFTYKCRHISSQPDSDQSIYEFTFHHNELEVAELTQYYKRWSEYEIVRHRSNSDLKMITLDELPERGRTKCRWITIGTTGTIFDHENTFEDFELIKVEE